MSSPPDVPEQAIPARLTALRELADSLRPVILADHTDSGLQGLSGLVGQYRAALAEIEQLEARLPAAKGTVLDEIAARRATAGPSRPAQRRVGR